VELASKNEELNNSQQHTVFISCLHGIHYALFHGPVTKVIEIIAMALNP
jgi:hypothetical protein